MSHKVTLRDYVDSLFAEKEKALIAALASAEKAVSAALEAADKAVTKAETNAEKWRENANEWRGAMSDRDRELPSRRELAAEIARLEALIAPLTRMSSNTEGRREGVSMSAAAVLAIVTVAVSVIAVITTVVIHH